MTLWNRCQQAASYLDQKYPDWWKEINLDWLDLEKSACCVCSQLKGKSLSFLVWRDQIRSMVGKHEECFAHPKGMPRSEGKEYYKQLTKYWKTLIKQRKEKDVN